MYETEGRFWPTEQDREARSVRYWVQRIDTNGEYDGMSDITLTEGREQIEHRLRTDFTAYRYVHAAKVALIGWAEGFRYEV